MVQGPDELEFNRTTAVTTRMLALDQPPEPREHFLVLLEGWQSGWSQQLPRRPVRLGRRSGCDIPIPDPKVSGLHCELLAQGPHLQVRDLGSTNGTFVEGERVAGQAELPPGALLRVGDQLFRHDHVTPTEAARWAEQSRDLQRARSYVEALLPPPLTQGPVRTDWCFVPSASVGGDAFGYFQPDAHTFACYLVDVSGHGAGAALHGVSVMNVLRQQALPQADLREPAQVLASLNAMFQMESHGGMYFSIWYGVADLRTRVLRYACAGHHPAWLAAPGRPSLVPLGTRNPVIGALPQPQLKAAETLLPAASTLYVFSDGCFEVVGADGAQRGLPQFLPLLRQAPPAAGEAARLYRAVRGAARAGPLDDDFTLLAVTFP